MEVILIDQSYFEMNENPQQEKSFQTELLNAMDNSQEYQKISGDKDLTEQILPEYIFKSLIEHAAEGKYPSPEGLDEFIKAALSPEEPEPEIEPEDEDNAEEWGELESEPDQVPEQEEGDQEGDKEELDSNPFEGIFAEALESMEDGSEGQPGASGGGSGGEEGGTGPGEESDDPSFNFPGPGQDESEDEGIHVQLPPISDILEGESVTVRRTGGRNTRGFF